MLEFESGFKKVMQIVFVDKWQMKNNDLRVLILCLQHAHKGSVVATKQS